MQKSRVGIIGLGLLGSAIAERLLAAKIDLLGWDIAADRRENFRNLGGQVAQSAREVAHCDRVMLSLPNSEVVRSVVDDLRPVVKPNTLLIDTTTGDPALTERLGRELADRSIGYVDATVAGSSEQARQGDVIVMAGGTRRQFDTCADIFAAFARRAYHVGDCGSGSRMKLVVNLVLGLNRAVLGEGLLLAAAADVDLAAALEILRDSAAYSTVMDTKGEKMISEDFATQARLAQHLKDVELILDLAARNEVHLPFSNIHQRLLKKAVELGFADADNSAIIKALQAK